jgi:AcrR family transcriptional regulator
MELFWARGYVGVTLEDLQVAMGGITPPSFYHASGSKEELFLKAAGLYLATIAALTRVHSEAMNELPRQDHCLLHRRARLRSMTLTWCRFTLYWPSLLPLDRARRL